MMIRFKSGIKPCLKQQSGGAVIEFAFIAPVLILILAGVLEFGTYYLRSQTVNRAVANLSHSINLDPTDQSIKNLRDQEGLGLVNLDTEGSSDYVCAVSYKTQAMAEEGGCSGTRWDTSAPEPGLTEYYVAVSANVQKESLTGLFSDLLPDIQSHNVVKVNLNDAAEIEKIKSELNSSTTTTTQTITDIQKEIVQIGKDVDSLEDTAASIPVTLICRKTEYQVGVHETRAHEITFSAAECGGKLPDATYVGVLSNTEVCGADESWEAKQPMFRQSAGVTFWTLGDCGADASNPASRAANILVVYFKVVK